MNLSKILKYQILVLFVVLIFNTAIGQEVSFIIDKSYDNLSWEAFVKKVEANSKLQIYSEDSSLINFKVSIDKEQKLTDALSDILNPLGLKFSIDSNGNIFITNEDAVKLTLPSNFFKIQNDAEKFIEEHRKQNELNSYLSTRKALIRRNITVGNKKNGVGKTVVEIDGFVRFIENGNPIIGASLYFEELQTGTTTNDMGYFTIKLKKGKYSVKVNSIETKEEKYQFDVLSDGRVEIYLEKRVYALNEVVIKSDKEDNIRSTQMGFDKINAKSIKEIPAVMGERDIVKVALLLPGVQTVGEGASGYNVRGSPADQNIFYLNSIPVYNTSHLFGFFSAFTPDAMSSFKLYKSNIPAKYGGRLSSIFDLTTKEGNKKKFSLRGGISPITTSLLVEGPFQEDKSSYLVAVRSTYSDWILGMIDNYEISNSKGTFGDAIANFTLALSPKDKLKLVSYFSKDDISLVSQSDYNYQNVGASLSWDHILKNKHNFQLIYDFSNYTFNEENKQLDWAAYKSDYNLLHNELRAQFTIRPNEKHNISVGLNGILYNLDRGKHLPLSDSSSVVPVYLGQEKGIESGIYIDEEWNINPVFAINGGIRLNYYTYLGPQDVYNYIPNQPYLVENIIDTTHYGNNQQINSHINPDFRLAAKYIINPNLSVKASFSQIHQYIFMLSNTIAMSPTDKWKLSDKYIEPMKGTQYSVGVFSNFFKNSIELSVEAYYKQVANLVEYKDGADLLVTKVVETEILQGNLDAYGIEFMLKKPSGKLNGWLNYTYSSSSVLVRGEDEITSINFGNKYPANYDKPHAFNLVMNYKLSRRLSFSGNVVYSTGRPITYPTAIFYQDGAQITYYSGRNEYRLPDYFRLDLAVNLEGNLKKNKLFHGSWSLSVYNVTGRRNAYSVYFKTENGSIKGYKLSIFGAPIVSLTYNFKLGNYDD
ncbi:MAG: TonB-dependent receptor [Marinilabiliales bacterium]|nr:MAG: TonB-dependent receptor [Marinilabiliales bacterium]